MENSGFQFKGFKIRKSVINLIDNNDLDLSIVFKPSGILDKSKSSFLLKLIVEIKSSSSDFSVEVNAEGLFTYSNMDDEKLSSLLYLNAPAILFPYLRAYVSSLTALSGINPITLPTLNLSGLKEQLEENTKVIDA